VSVCVFMCMYIIGTLCYQNNKGNSSDEKKKKKRTNKRQKLKCRRGTFTWIHL